MLSNASNAAANITIATMLLRRMALPVQSTAAPDSRRFTKDDWWSAMGNLQRHHCRHWRSAVAT
jgi:hypothetical protein